MCAHHRELLDLVHFLLMVVGGGGGESGEGIVVGSLPTVCFGSAPEGSERYINSKGKISARNLRCDPSMQSVLTKS